MDEQEILSEIQLMSDLLFQLQQDVDQIKSEVIDSQFADLLDKLNQLIKKTDENLVKGQSEINLQKKEFLQLKEQIKPNDTNNQVKR
mgnify:CR=1 FL=1